MNRSYFNSSPINETEILIVAGNKYVEEYDSEAARADVVIFNSQTNELTQVHSSVDIMMRLEYHSLCQLRKDQAMAVICNPCNENQSSGGGKFCAEIVHFSRSEDTVLIENLQEIMVK